MATGGRGLGERLDGDARKRRREPGLAAARSGIGSLTGTATGRTRADWQEPEMEISLMMRRTIDRVVCQLKNLGAHQPDDATVQAGDQRPRSSRCPVARNIQSPGNCRPQLNSHYCYCSPQTAKGDGGSVHEARDGRLMRLLMRAVFVARFGVDFRASGG